MMTPDDSMTGATGRRRASLFGAVACLMLGGLAVAVPFVPNVDAGAMAASLLGAVGVFAIVRKRQGRFDVFEPYLVVGAIYFVYFGVGTMYHLVHPEEMISMSLTPYLRPALGLAVVGWACFTLGYVLLFTGTQPSASERLVITRPRALLVPALIGFLGHAASVMQENLVWAGKEFSGSLSALQQAAPVFFFAWALAWLLVWSGRLRGTDRAVVVGVLLPLAFGILYFKAGGKLVAITMAGIPIIAFWYARRRLPKFAVTSLILITVLVLFPIYNTLRTQSRKLDTTVRFERTLTVASGWNAQTFYDRSLGAFLRRMAIVTSVAAILRDAGRTVDYKYGETLLLTPISLFIPRLVWPDKPSINVGREFAEKFHLVSEVDRHTQIAPSILGELYWNFGIPAVVLGMFLLGGAFRWVYARYAARSALQPFSKAIYITLLTYLVQIETTVAMMFGVVVKTIVLLWAIVILLRFLGVLRNEDGAAPAMAPARN